MITKNVTRLGRRKLVLKYTVYVRVTVFALVQSKFSVPVDFDRPQAERAFFVVVVVVVPCCIFWILKVGKYKEMLNCQRRFLVRNCFTGMMYLHGACWCRILGLKPNLTAYSPCLSISLPAEILTRNPNKDSNSQPSKYM